MEPFIIGTAGHVDHGKTTLIKALTGTDADRLKEEKARGMTIELGYAYKKFEDGICLSFVDVPGHERLVKTMVSGAAGMDLGLLIIDAKEGVMPQTEEHLQILRLLNVKDVVVAITKIDLVSEDQLLFVREEIALLLNETPYSKASIIPVSAISGQGIKALEQCLYERGKNFSRSESSKGFRMPIDRVFSITGHGTVVTGTIKDGRVKKDQKVNIYTARGNISSKAKCLQVHHQEVEEAVVGQRLALLLHSIPKDAIEPGDVLTMDERMVHTDWLDVQLTNASNEKIKHNQVIRFHMDTKEIQGRLRIIGADDIGPRETGFASIRLMTPIIANRGDRFIIRKMSPMITLGGGRILSNEPAFKKRHSKETKSYFNTYANDDRIDEIVMDLLKQRVFMTYADLVSFLNEENSFIDQILNKLQEEERIQTVGHGFMLAATYRDNSLKLKQLIETWYRNNTYALYMPKETLISQGRRLMPLPVLEFCLMEGIKQGQWFSYEHMLAYNVEERRGKINRNKHVQAIRQRINEGQYVGKTWAELEDLHINPKDLKAIISFLNDTHSSVTIHEGRFVSNTYLMQFLKQLQQLFKKQERITVVEVKAFTKLSRKPAILLLEYCDGQGYTKRDGNERLAQGIWDI